MSSKGLTAVAMLVAMVVLAQWYAACVGPAAPPPAPGKSGDTDTAAPQPVQEGGTLIVGWAGEPQALDVLSNSVATTRITSLIAENLVARRYHRRREDLCPCRAGFGGELGGLRGRADLHLPPAPGGQVYRWCAVRRRRGQGQLRSRYGPRITAVLRAEAGRRGQPDQDDCQLSFRRSAYL